MSRFLLINCQHRLGTEEQRSSAICQLPRSYRRPLLYWPELTPRTQWMNKDNDSVLSIGL